MNINKLHQLIDSKTVTKSYILKNWINPTYIRQYFR